MLMLLSALVLAAQADAVAVDPAAGGPRQIFIAPSGEPFRAGGGTAYPVAQWFAAADKNGDGKLDFAEFEADFMRFFDQLDVDHDGAIDGVERNRYETQVAPETLGGSWLQERGQDDSEDRKVDFGGDDQGGSTLERPKPKYGSNPIGAARFDLLGLPEPVAAMDTELRGRITRSVAEKAARDRFDLLDTLHRGYLTLDTLPRTYAQDHHHGGGGGGGHSGGGKRGGHRWGS